MNRVFFSLFMLMCININSFAQIDEYSYKRELLGISNQWHKVILPSSIYKNESTNLNNIRIYGITASNDTIEAPYIMQPTKEKTISNEIQFKLINKSRNINGYYFTFEIPTQNPINKMVLDFKQLNFDWKVELEGSQNQLEWFTLVNNYRILSINNDITDYQFTTINFSSAKYNYFRLRIISNTTPILKSSTILQQEVTKGKYCTYNINKTDIKHNKQTKLSEIDIDLKSVASISNLKININDSFDYYRPITIKYVVDSFNTEQGWKYTYNNIGSGTLNSIEPNRFYFESTTVKKLKIIIHNYDNQPLSIGTIEAKGYLNELTIRFTKPASYFLVYGNSKAGKPHYDIDHFTNKIPSIISTLELGEELVIHKTELSKKDPLFKNQIWLWAIMVLIILILGWFSFKMISKS